MFTLKNPAESVQFSISVQHMACYVHSRLDYCNSLYLNLPKTQLNRLQHIQSSLAHAVVAAPRSSAADHILKSFHWLKVLECIEYKLFPLLISFSGFQSLVCLVSLEHFITSKSI